MSLSSFSLIRSQEWTFSSFFVRCSLGHLPGKAVFGIAPRIKPLGRGGPAIGGDTSMATAGGDPSRIAIVRFQFRRPMHNETRKSRNPRFDAEIAAALCWSL